MSSIEERVKKVVAEQLDVSGDIDNNASFIDDLGADSLEMVEIVMELEEVFDCEIYDEEAEQITTVQQAIDLFWMRHDCATRVSVPDLPSVSESVSEGNSSHESFFVLEVAAIALILGIIFIAMFAENNNTDKFITNSPYQSDQSKRFIKSNSHKTEPNSVQKNCRKGVMFFDKAQGEWVDCVKIPNSNTNNTN